MVCICTSIKYSYLLFKVEISKIVNFCMQNNKENQITPFVVFLTKRHEILQVNESTAFRQISVTHETDFKRQL